MSDRPLARYIKAGEPLAIDTSAIRSGPQGFFWLFGPSSPRNDRRGDVAIVHVRGPLDHHSDAFDDNYESILSRVEEAFSGEDARKAHEQKHRWDDAYEPAVAEPPSAVILCIDSPGGVVSGLNETVKSLQKMRKEADIPLVAYVNEMAASAAYALACSCDRIFAPKSAILGSVGVISTMISQDAKNKKDGYDVRLITSGARKADGHVHAPISDDAVDVERGRVEKLALDFFKLVARSRDLSVDKIASFQAGIFLGAEAKKRGLADGVCSLDECVASLSKGEKASAPAGAERAKGNETDRRAARVRARHEKAQTGTGSKKHLDGREKSSSVRLTLARSGTNSAEIERMSSKSILALIKKQEAAIAKELAGKADPEKLAALYADLGAYKKTEKHVEHTKSEEYDDEGDEDEGDEEDDDEEDDEDEKKSSKKSSKATSGEEDDEEEEAKGSSDKKAAAPVSPISALLGGLTGSALEGRLAAIIEKAEKYDALAADVGQMKADAKKSKRNALIDEAVAQRRITRGQAKQLRSAKLAYVEQFLSMHTHALVNIDEEALHVPAGTPAAHIAPNVKAMVEQAIEARGLTGEAAESFRKAAYEDQLKASSGSEGVH